MPVTPKSIRAALSLRDSGGNAPKSDCLAAVSNGNSSRAVHHQECANSVWAQAYAAAGIAVFPCSPTPKRDSIDKPDKGPIGRLAPKGWQSAVADIEVVRDWWSAEPYSLIGLPCGPVGVVVIDLDIRPDANGVEAFRDLLRRYGPLPSGVVIVRTISGGVHLYFSQPAEPFGNSTGALPCGIDVRGDGGYVIAPGSLWHGQGWHEIESSPHLLETLDKKSLPQPPGWLVDLIRPPHRLAQIAKHRPLIAADDDAEAAYVTDALDFIPADDRDVWFRIGGALHDKFGPAGRAIWDCWSQGSSKFEPAVQDRTWRSFDRPAQHRTGVGYIVAEARRNGFRRPKARRGET